MVIRIPLPRFKNPFRKSQAETTTPIQAVDDLKSYAFFGSGGAEGFQTSFFDGEKFPTGFGVTQNQVIDYWTLRMRSSQLFNENLYARGLIRRLVTNEINTGLTPEAILDEDILGIDEDTLSDWAEKVETRFTLWSKNARICDWKRRLTFGGLQRIARAEAIVSGDILVTLRNSRRTRLQQVQLISGNQVMNPTLTSQRINLQEGHTLLHGVERDKEGRDVAYYVRQEDGNFKRLPAFGERSGRRLAWLVFGTDKRLDDRRGQPLLALVLQSLKEIDRYRDSAQRQAVVNSIIAMFIKKTEEKMGTLPITGGAVRRDQGTVTDGDGSTRSFDIARMIPGLVFQELQTGEEPEGFTGKIDVDFAAFETAVIQAVAWANEIPPEILLLSFSNNYSASQAAINEFKIYLNKVWTEWGEGFCQPIYSEWLISEVLLRNVDAPGLLESWRNPMMYPVFGAWTGADWYGSIKPSTDMLKQAKGSKLLVAEGWSTNTREARGLTGTKFRRNIKRTKKENELKVEALRPLAEFRQEFGIPIEDVDPTGGGSSNTPQAVSDGIQAVRDGIDELLSRVEEN